MGNKNKKKRNDELKAKEEELTEIYDDELDGIIDELDEIADDETVEEEYVIEDEVEEPTTLEEVVEEEFVLDDSDYDDELFNDEENVVYSNSKIKKANKIINIIFVVIMLLLALVAIDVVCVSKYDKGPFFAIPIHKYDDGGTKEYYGLGYKVIKYHQNQGRRDTVLGSWGLKYNDEPITVEDIDLAINFNDKTQKTYEKYYKQFVRISSTLQNVDTKNNKLILGYKDEDDKYTLNIECKLVKDQNIKKFEKGKEITIIGSVTDYQVKTKKQPNTLYIDNCFGEQ